jgi:hypothetical protein
MGSTGGTATRNFSGQNSYDRIEWLLRAALVTRELPPISPVSPSQEPSHVQCRRRRARNRANPSAPSRPGWNTLSRSHPHPAALCPNPRRPPDAERTRGPPSRGPSARPTRPHADRSRGPLSRGTGIRPTRSHAERTRTSPRQRTRPRENPAAARLASGMRATDSEDRMDRLNKCRTHG